MTTPVGPESGPKSIEDWVPTKVEEPPPAEKGSESDPPAESEPVTSPEKKDATGTGPTPDTDTLPPFLANALNRPDDSAEPKVWRPPADFIGPVTPEQEALRSGPATPDPDAESLLPPTLAEGSEPPAHSTAGLPPDDPRVTLIDQGYAIRDIDQEVAALQAAPLDMQGAQDGVAAANKKEEQFWTGVYDSMDRAQIERLAPMAKDIKTAEDPQAAQRAFDSELLKNLSPEQLTQLRSLRRGIEDAQLHLEGQALGQRLRDTLLSRTACVSGAESVTQDPYSLAQSDARVFVSGQHQTLANRRLEDAMTSLMTPENQQALAPYQQDVLEAAAALKSDPDNTGAQQHLENAQKTFNDQLTSLISPADHATLEGLIAAADSESALGTLLGTEAATHHRVMDLSLAAQSRGGLLNDTERKMLDLAQGEYDIVLQNRGVRSLAVQAAEADEGADSKEKLGQLDTAIADLLSARSDQAVDQAQFNLDIASHEPGIKVAAETINTPASQLNALLAPPGGDGSRPFAQSIAPAAFGPVKPAPLTIGAEFAPYLPSPNLSLTDATNALNTARTERDDLQAQIQAQQEAQEQAQQQASGKGFWERALDVGTGVLETAAGVALMAAAGWTGVGAVAGGVLIAHGLANTAHSVTDWATDAETATPLSRGLQTLGVDPGAADRIDVGVSFVGMTAAGGLGTASLLLRGGSMATKAAGGLSGALVLDSGQAQGRYVLANDRADPLAVDALTGMGMSHTLANYVMLGGSMVAVGGLAAYGGRSGGTPVSAEMAATSPDAVSPAIRGQTADLLTSRSSNFFVSGREPADVAIIGATGNVGRTTLVDIAAARLDGLTNLNPVGLVRPDANPRVDRIADLVGPARFNETLRGGVHEVTLTRDNFAYLNTPEGIQALQNAGTIVISAPDVAASRMGLFGDLRDYGVLADPNKSIILIRAGQGGQPALADMIHSDPSIRATIIGVEDSPYGTRVFERGDDGVLPIGGKRKNDVEIAIAGDREQGLAAIRGLFPRGAEISQPSWPNFPVVPGSAMPWRAGFFIHPGVALWPSNLARTMNGEKYLHYAEGVRDAEHGAYLQALDDVKVELGRAYGASPQTFAEKLNTQFGLELIPGEPFHETMARTVERPDVPLSKKIYTSTSYSDLDGLFRSRYINEDLASAFTMRWYADRAGLRFPALDQYLSDGVRWLREAGMSEADLNTNLYGYMPYLNRITGDAAQIAALLDHPHAR